MTAASQAPVPTCSRIAILALHSPASKLHRTHEMVSENRGPGAASILLAVLDALASAPCDKCMTSMTVERLAGNLVSLAKSAHQRHKHFRRASAANQPQVTGLSQELLRILDSSATTASTAGLVFCTLIRLWNFLATATIPIVRWFRNHS